MADFTDYLEQEILDWAFTVSAVTRPTAWWIALFTTTPTADAGTGGTEVSAGGYSRQGSITFSRSASTLTPSTSVSFGPATASWGTVNGFGVYDSSSGGNLLAFEDLTTPRAIGDGDSAKFSTSDLSITLD